LGDFTGYAGAPDREALVVRPSIGQQLLWAVVIGLFFAVIVVLFLAASGLFFTRYYILRLFVCLVPAFVMVVFFFGDFKTLLGGREEYIVLYELPYGPERLLVSLACGILLAITTTAAVIMVGWARPLRR
jgi:hypothetical protein